MILCRFDASQKNIKIHRNWLGFKLKYVISLKISKIGKYQIGIYNYIPIAFKWYLYHSIILNTIIDTASSSLVVIGTTRQKAWMNHVLTSVKSNWCICIVVNWTGRKNVIILTINTDLVGCEFFTKKREIDLYFLWARSIVIVQQY